jgi:hypothetical protein
LDAGERWAVVYLMLRILVMDGSVVSVVDSAVDA